MLPLVRNMLLRISYETKLELEASVILVIPFIVIVILLSTRLSLLADAAALDTVGDVACHLALLAALVMMMRRRRGHLVAVHGLDSIVKGHDARGRLGVHGPHHAIIPHENEIVIAFSARAKQ